MGASTTSSASSNSVVANKSAMVRIPTQISNIPAPTLSAISATSGLVVSANAPTKGASNTAVYNFHSSSGTSTLTDLWVDVYSPVTYPNTSASNPSPITTGIPPVIQITVSTGAATTSGAISTAATAVVVNGVAHITGLNIPVPATDAGQNVYIVPTYNYVGANGITTGSSAKLGISEYKYIASGNVAVDSKPLTTVQFSNPVILVSSNPIVTSVSSTISSTSNTASVPFGPNTQVLQFSISAPTTSAVRVKQIGVTPNYTGSMTSTTFKIYNVSNTAVTLNGTSGQNIKVGTGVQLGLTFTTPEVIAAGTTKIYAITVDTTALSGSASNIFRLDLTNTGDTVVNDILQTISNQTSWLWNDSTVSGQTTTSEKYLNGYGVKQVTGVTLT